MLASRLTVREHLLEMFWHDLPNELASRVIEVAIAVEDRRIIAETGSGISVCLGSTH